MRAVDVEDVERERHVRDPLRLGHELLGEHRRRDHVEDVDALERHRALAAQPARRQRLLGRPSDAAGRRPRLPGRLADRREQVAALGKVTVERRPRDPGRGGDLAERGARRLIEQPLPGGEDPVTVALRVRPHAPPAE